MGYTKEKTRKHCCQPQLTWQQIIVQCDVCLVFRTAVLGLINSSQSWTLLRSHLHMGERQGVPEGHCRKPECGPCGTIVRVAWLQVWLLGLELYHGPHSWRLCCLLLDKSMCHKTSRAKGLRKSRCI